MSAWLVVPLFLFSGMAGLIYEVIWSRALVLVMGATTFAITTVLVAFMGGLALGSALAGRYAGRASQPQRAYGVLELFIGVYGLATPWLLHVAEPLYRLLYEQSGQSFWLLVLARFLVSSLFLVVPTTLMGATLPLLVQYMAIGRGKVGAPVAVLYAINTFGAVLGAAAAGFVTIPLFGLSTSTQIAAALNMLVAGFVWLLPREFPGPGAAAEKARGLRAAPPVPPPELDTTRGRARMLIFAGFALSGAAAMIYQVCWTRALIMSVGPHTYGFTCILAAYITGLGIGSLAVARWVDRWRYPVAAFGLMEVGVAASALAGVPLFGTMPGFVLDVVKAHSSSFNVVLLYEFLAVQAIILVPTALFGAIFPLINRLCARQTDESGRTVGIAYAVNTVGTIAGTIGAGFLMIPAESFGVRRTILAAVVLNASIGLALIVCAAGRRWRVGHWASAAAAAATLAGVALVPTWNTGRLNSAAYWGRQHSVIDQRVRYYREGIDATVAVTEARGVRSLRINGKIDASNGMDDGYTHVAFPHLAVYSAPKVERMLIIGLGSGISLGSAATHEEIRQIDCVELSEAVVEASRQEFAEYCHGALDSPRVNLIRADGRNHLLLTSTRYDVILSIPSNPWMAGVSSLFTREYFELCKRRLTPQGRLCAWLQAYSISLEDFQSVVRTVASVFPFITLWQGASQDCMIIASAGPFTIDAGRFISGHRVPQIRSDLLRIGYAEPHVLASTLVAGGDPLSAWAAGALIHTDDNAHLEFSTPRSLFASERVAVTILKDLFDRAAMPVDELIRHDAGRPEQVAFMEQAHMGQSAARLRTEAAYLSWTGRYAAAVRTCSESYYRYPSQPMLLSQLRSFVGLGMWRAQRDNDRELLGVCEPLAQVLEALPAPPMVIPKTAPAASASG